MDLLGGVVELDREVVDLLRQVAVLPEQIGLSLVDLVAVPCRRLLVASSVRVCAFWAMITGAPV